MLLLAHRSEIPRIHESNFQNIVIRIKISVFFFLLDENMLKLNKGKEKQSKGEIANCLHYYLFLYICKSCIYKFRLCSPHCFSFHFHFFFCMCYLHFLFSVFFCKHCILMWHLKNYFLIYFLSSLQKCHNLGILCYFFNFIF